ncbi:unnamed protein product [Blepharisma stoltei]|uniref:SAP domain-containing protein n=1 Tax=Blepharisma stoltei TaxID=1481888 RepID=A0AAU9IQN3_9CILI|nr:unnamed protein product [Blepharisma stoltei]
MAKNLSLKEEFEYRDARCIRAEPYWRARARCQSLGLSCIGTREELIRRFELFSFNSENVVNKLSPEELEKLSDTPLERFASSSWLTTAIQLVNDASPQMNTKLPWKVVPEISYMNKKIASDDVLKAIGALMRPTFCFYNHIVDNKLAERLVALIFLPYTCDFASQAPESIIRHLAAALGLTCKLDHKELQQAVERQKLLEMIYTVLDSEALHGVTFCQTHFSLCRYPASSLCTNFMCSICCGLHQQRVPCHIHDRPVQFFRYRLRSLYEFEENMDRSLTLRLFIKDPLRKIQLYRVFEGYAVRWDRIQVWHNPSTHRIQYIYLTFLTQEDARATYLSRRELIKKTDLRFRIENLPENLQELQKRYRNRGINPDRVLVIIDPCLRKTKPLIPPKHQVIPEIIHLAASITGLHASMIHAEASQSPLSDNFSVREFYLEFPSADSCQTFFNAQPYFQFLISHKLSHLIPCPFLKPPSLCLQCTRPKECNNDLCADCCSRFSSNPLYCCSTAHSSYSSPPILTVSLQNRRLLDMNPGTMIRKIPEKVGKFHMMIRHMLDEGIYTWYRPRFYLGAETMKGANQELQVVLDSGLPRNTISQNSALKKEGKIFNFLSSQPLISNLEGKQLTEGMDHAGNTFLEYAYHPIVESDISHNYDKAEYEENSYTRQDFIDDTTHIGYNLRNSFHFFLAGLDSYKKGLKELVAKEIRNKLGRINIEDMILIDKDSLLANMLLMDISAENNIESYHRIMCVKLANETDAIKLILGEVNLVLPLSNGHVGSPIVVPSAELCQFIHTQYEEYMRNPAHSIPSESMNPDKVPQISKQQQQPKRR